MKTLFGICLVALPLTLASCQVKTVDDDAMADATDTSPDAPRYTPPDVKSPDLSWLVCCVEGENVYFSAVKDDCAGDTLTIVDEETKCALVCCQVDAQHKTIASGTCAAAGGTEVDKSKCQPATAQCTSDSDCDDKNPCTYESCVNSTCQYKPESGAACDDGDECTTGEQCYLGICKSYETDPQCGDKVCCRTAEMQYAYLLADDCPTPVDADKCEESEVCCKGDDDPVMVAAKDCPSHQLLPPGDCGDICCVQGESATDMSADECTDAGGKVYDNMMCDTVCCEMSSATYLVPGAICHQEGDEVAVEECDQVCCAWEDGQFFKLSKADCHDAVVDNDKCDDSLVCCDLGDGPKEFLASDCLPGVGDPEHAEACGDICCLYKEDGLWAHEIMSGLKCNDDYAGDDYVPDWCDEICCFDETKYFEASIAECKKTGNPAEAQWCEDVCCIDGQNVEQIEKGNCAAEIKPEDQCDVVCCLDDVPGPVPKGLCAESAEWVDCPGYCNTSADCGDNTCSEDKTKAIKWVCSNWTCQQEEVACTDGKQCVNGTCLTVLDPDFKVGGGCSSENVDFPPNTDFETLKWVLLTITHNSITCCANKGCGFFNEEEGPGPCDFPIILSSGSGTVVNVDVSGWEANVGDSYLVLVEPPYYYVSGQYTDTWCNDNWPEPPWNEDYPGYTAFMVTPFHEVCCELGAGEYGLMSATDCDTPVDGHVCTGMSVCCMVGGEAKLMTPFECYQAGGKPESPEECDQACCYHEDTQTGSVMETGLCTPGEEVVLLPDMCNQGCCKSEAGYTKTNLAECLDDKGYFVADDLCEEVCCYLGAYQNAKLLKGECNDKGWNVHETPSDCDMVCCNVWGSYEVQVKYQCYNSIIAWENCPGKCNAPADCGAPTCHEENPTAYNFYECVDNNCNPVILDCPEGQGCYDGSCS